MRVWRCERNCRRHDLVVRFVAGHELCRRFMQIPGVGPVTDRQSLALPTVARRGGLFLVNVAAVGIIDRRAGADQQACDPDVRPAL